MVRHRRAETVIALPARGRAQVVVDDRIVPGAVNRVRSVICGRASCFLVRHGDERGGVHRRERRIGGYDIDLCCHRLPHGRQQRRRAGRDEDDARHATSDRRVGHVDLRADVGDGEGRAEQGDIAVLSRFLLDPVIFPQEIRRRTLGGDKLDRLMRGRPGGAADGRSGHKRDRGDMVAKR